MNRVQFTCHRLAETDTTRTNLHCCTPFYFTGKSFLPKEKFKATHTYGIIIVVLIPALPKHEKYD